MSKKCCHLHRYFFIACGVMSVLVLYHSYAAICNIIVVNICFVRMLDIRVWFRPDSISIQCSLEVIMIRVYLDDLHHHTMEIPISQMTTCADVIAQCTSFAKERHRYHLAEIWRGHGMWFICKNNINVLTWISVLISKKSITSRYNDSLKINPNHLFVETITKLVPGKVTVC